MGYRWLAPAVLAGVALAVTACGSTPGGSTGTANTNPGATPTAGAGGGGGGSTSTSGLKFATISGGQKILETAKGWAVYRFSKDTKTKSACNGVCAKTWPPVLGTLKAGHHIKASVLGTIKRANGQVQATYKGYPLYTYTNDSAPNMNSGNGVSASGGVWYDIPSHGKGHHHHPGKGHHHPGKGHHHPGKGHHHHH